ncbi:MAG: hypothetical protein JW759_04300 [Candidatus Coatesbacteria bacterium]|nr:hypothetical protein [Candidatus Coatesbacteria bacterium]
MAIDKGFIYPDQDESDEHFVKKFEALYQFLWESFNSELQRWERIDTKVAAFMAASVVLLGLSLASADRIWSVRPGILAVISLVSVCLFVLAIVVFCRALLFQKTFSLPAPQMIEHFRQNTYIDILYSVSRRFAEAIGRNRDALARKLRWAFWGNLLMLIGLGMLLVAVVSNVIYRY